MHRHEEMVFILVLKSIKNSNSINTANHFDLCSSFITQESDSYIPQWHQKILIHSSQKAVFARPQQATRKPKLKSCIEMLISSLFCVIL